MLRPSTSTFYQQGKRRIDYDTSQDNRELAFLADWATSKTKRPRNQSFVYKCTRIYNHRTIRLMIFVIIFTCIFLHWFLWSFNTMDSQSRGDVLSASVTMHHSVGMNAESFFYSTTTIETMNETLEEYNVSSNTGSFQNCSTPGINWFGGSSSARLLHHHQEQDSVLIQDQNYLSGIVVVSCVSIRYRIPYDSIQRAAQAKADIIVGILSNAANDGPMRRQVIRHTWASHDISSSTTKDSILQQIQKTTLSAASVTLGTSLDSSSSSFIITKPGVFFLVAGTWSDQLSKEFQLYRDLIWIDQAEVYDAETSVLTYKTQSFASIVHREMKRFDNERGGIQYSYLFKTDDDSYVNLKYLEYELIERKRVTPIYPQSIPFMWGICTYMKRRPLRDSKYKWSISRKAYPEELYPTYCEGAGFALSRKLVDCIVDDHHIAQIRYMPFEDVSIGMLGERCHVELFVNAHELIHLYRSGYPYGSAEEYTRVDLNLGRLPDGDWLPEANMTSRIVQHRINSDVDMIEHHLKMLNSFYYEYYSNNTN